MSANLQLDQYALHQIYELNKTVKHFYDKFEFFRGQSIRVYLKSSGPGYKYLHCDNSI